MLWQSGESMFSCVRRGYSGRLISMMPQQTQSQTRWSKVMTRLREWEEATLLRAATDDALVAIYAGPRRGAERAVASTVTGWGAALAMRPTALAA